MKPLQYLKTPFVQNPKIPLFCAAIWLLTIGQPACQKKIDKASKAGSNIKSTWISDAFAVIESGNYPRIRAIAWWHENFGQSYLQINTSHESLQAYQNGIGHPLFTGIPQFAGNKLQPDNNHIYHAAFPGFGGTEDQVSSQKITDFEQLAGKPLAWVYFSSNWYDSIRFPENNLLAIRQAGKVPFIRMMPRTNFTKGGPDPNYTMQRIIDGTYDSALAKYAAQIAGLGYPVLMEFGTEMNGNWFPWNGQYNGGGIKDQYGDPSYYDGPERFRDAYRHIIHIFKSNGAENVTWFFHVDAAGSPASQNAAWNDVKYYYPGDDYVDWIGVSIYGAQTPNEDCIQFEQSLKGVYDSLTKMSGKPIAVLEWATTEQ